MSQGMDRHILKRIVRPSQGPLYIESREFMDLDQRGLEIDINAFSVDSVAGEGMADVSIADRTNYTQKVRGEKKKKKKKKSVKFPADGQHILESYGVYQDPEWAVMSEDEHNADAGDTEDGVSKNKFRVINNVGNVKAAQGTFNRKELSSDDQQSFNDIHSLRLHRNGKKDRELRHGQIDRVAVRKESYHS